MQQLRTYVYFFPPCVATEQKYFNEKMEPVGGIIMGAITFVKGESPSLPNINLKPGEYCRISLDLAK